MFGRVAARFQQPLFEQILRQVVRLHVLLDVRPVLGMLAAGHDLEQRPEVGKVELHQRPAPGGALFRVRKAAEQRGERMVQSEREQEKGLQEEGFTIQLTPRRGDASARAQSYPTARPAAASRWKFALPASSRSTVCPAKAREDWKIVTELVF